VPDLLSNLSILLSLYTYFWYEFKLFWKVAMCCQLSSVDKLLENCENIFGHCWLMDSQFMGHDHPTTLGSRTPSPNCFFLPLLSWGLLHQQEKQRPTGQTPFFLDKFHLQKSTILRWGDHISWAFHPNLCGLAGFYHLGRAWIMRSFQIEAEADWNGDKKRKIWWVVIASSRSSEYSTVLQLRHP